MSTQRLFDDNGFLLEFEATVLECRPEKDCFAVLLDRTAFAPEGGGQGADTGILGELPVLDVQEDAQRNLWHFLNAPLPIGAVICGKVEEATRIYRLQNHSGEHILSGLIYRHYGYRNVGFHLGQTEVTLDTDGVLSATQLADLEWEANRVILENRPIRATYPTPETLSAMEYRAKLDLTEHVRIVEIEGIDRCACCAPHVNTTGQVGILRILSAMHYKGGMRLHILCGLAALEAWRAQSKQVSTVSGALSVPADAIAQGVTRLQEENLSLRQAASAARDARVAELIDALAPIAQRRAVFTTALDAKGMRDLAQGLLSKSKDATLVLCPRNESEFSFVFASEDRAQYNTFAALLSPKGGGKPPLFQGSVPCDRATLAQILSAHQWIISLN